MTSSLNMSLDDIIKSNKHSSRGTNSRGGAARNSGSGGPSRRFPDRSAGRKTPYIKPVEAPETVWKHDMFMSDDAEAYPVRAGPVSSVESGTKVFVSNLHYGVSNDDIKELFSGVGDLKQCSVHYDRSGRSKGTAEVIYSRRADAVEAIMKYNDVQLDGMPMKVEIVGNIMNRVGPPPSTRGMYGNQNGRPRSGQGRRGAMGRPLGGGRRGRIGRGQDRNHSEKTSAEDLDADLEKYHAEAMETN
ncbi:THO complex subunit 4A [Quillaja saponaria]|uniref:THO complex subunit 4A n=1 Tax=Quillaja saponaria TaxID=32244 RepID=A0AAD7Q9X9_QUISA|nr:THO complex subunit 4A [Quillaja saponaria]